MKPKYMLGLSLVLAAVAIVIIGGFASSNSYFMTVSELRGQTPEVKSQSLRISGAVIGDSIRFDVATLHLEFDIVDNIEQIGAQQPLRIAYTGPRPELLEAGAQAIVEGRLGADGVFHADTLLLKCPTRYEDRFPEQAEGL
jgi:cytochrome c-type biogenesis protein CcmE